MPVWIIVGLVIVIAAAGLLYRYRAYSSEVMSILLVAGIAGLATAVTFVRVQQYHTQQQATAEATAALSPNVEPAPPPLTNGPPREPVNERVYAPNERPISGGAAPPAAHNPYSGG